MKLFSLILLLVAGIMGSVQAQTYKLAGDSAGFIADVKVMMAATKQEKAMQVASRLETLWASQQMTRSQRERVIAVSQQMLAKKLKARPHFENFFGALVSGIETQKLPEAALEGYMQVVQRSLTQDPVAVLEKFLAASYTFLDSRFIYRSQYNTLRVSGGSFSFAYWDGTEAVAVKPEPATSAKKNGNAKAGANKAGGDARPETPAADSANAWPLPASSNMPAILGPVLKLTGSKLTFVANNDSVQISQVNGLVQLTKNVFVGQQGIFKWQQPEGEVTANFTNFSFNTANPAFKVENTRLSYPAVLEEPVEGVLEYRSVRNNANGQNAYPKFISYTNNARIKNIGADIRYLGGFTLSGSKVSTAALDGSLSDIIVHGGGKPKFKASASNYQLTDTLITSELAAVLIYQGTDSLTHPGLRFKYDKPNQTLYLTLNSQTQGSPFYNSYHQMEISAELLTWNIRQPEVEFSILNAKNEVPARLSSREYFTDTNYDHLQGTASFNPLIVMANYADKQKVNNFFLSEVARATQLPENALAVAAAMLARQNFLRYNSATGEVSLKPKAMHFMKSAQGKKDYDYITLRSLAPSGKNATLDLNKNSLLVRGVEKFYFTGDSAAVYAIPDSSQVYILKNRDIKFNGVVVASLFRFRGSKFMFKYDEFLVDMRKIDTIAFAVKRKQKQGLKSNNRGEQYLSNSINKSSGTLYLNKPDNKSGKERLKQYPMFDATGGAYVYFNRPEILGGVYDTTVYFAIPPFKMDSLSSDARSAVSFKGKFYSGGIFPPFEAKLTLMDDQSLGFDYQVPAGGILAYGGKGKFFNRLTMTNKGLQGNGQIDYLSTQLQSNAFTFYLDKVMTLGTKATVNEATIGDAYFMATNINKYALEWLPQKDTMNISTTTESIKLYQNKFTFRGITTITPKGFFGDGTIEGSDGSIKSPMLSFAKTRFKAGKAVFEVKSQTPAKPALRATDVMMEYDLTKGIVTFSPEKTGMASTDFPYAQFKTSLSSGQWDVNKKRVTMDEPRGGTAAKAYFVSTRPSHDHLKFQARTANYDISKNTLNIGGVPYVASADAHIVPDSNMVFIANADMRPLLRATVISDTLNRYHQLKGDINVISRTRYQGFGVTRYVNAVSDTFTVRFNKFTQFNMKPLPVAKAIVKVDKKADKDPVKLPDLEEGTPPDSLQLASAAEPAKKGFLRKGSRKKAKPEQQADSAGTQPEVPVLLADASATAKPKKSSSRNRRNKVAEIPDSTALALGTDLAETREMRKQRQSRDKGLSTIPADAAYTSAVATIKESDKFIITPGVQYKGNITMNSIRQHWDFDGLVKLAFTDGEGASDWFPYQATVNPAEVKINIINPVAADGTPLKAGLHVSVADNKIYHTFVSKKKDETDLDVFNVNGQLSYNKKNKEFRLGSEARVSGKAYKGNLLVYSDSLGMSRYEGKFNLIAPVKAFQLHTAGTAIGSPAEKRYTLNALMAVEMDLSEQVLKHMGDAITKHISGAPEASVDANSLPYRLAQFIGEKDAKAFAESSAYTPLASLSGDLLKGLTFSGVDLRWSDSSSAWFSKGKLNLSNILKKDINAQIPGYLEIKRGPDADIINIYLEPQQSLWYYFSFDNNTLLVSSSDEAFNDLVAKKKGKNVDLGEAMDKAAFVNYFRKTYLKDALPERVAPAIAAPKEKEAAQPAGFGFEEEDENKKNKKKEGKARESVLPKAADKPAREKAKPAKEMALPGMMEEGNKKKKKKNKTEDELLPDIDLN